MKPQVITVVALVFLAAEAPKQDAWRKTLQAVDKLRGKYGDDTIISLAAGMKSGFRQRVHENPENLPGKEPDKKK